MKKEKLTLFYGKEESKESKEGDQEAKSFKEETIVIEALCLTKNSANVEFLFF